MSLSDYKHGRTTQLHPGYVPYSSPVVGHYGKTPFRTFLDVRHTNTPENVHVKSSRVNFSKVQMAVFLLCLTLTFLIMASYVLMWDKKGLLTPPPYQPNGVDVPTNDTTAAAAVGVSLQSTSVDMEQLVRMIQSALEYPSRKLPDQKDIIGTDPHLFSVIPRHFLPGIKSPCWYEEFVGGTSIDPYASNLFVVRSMNFKGVCDQLTSNFRQSLRQQDGKLFRLRCLPYFYIVGQPKCGTTDLFRRLLLHPELRFNVMKEPHWWTRRRFGYIRFKEGLQERFPVEDYLDLFDLAAHKIQASSSGNSPGGRRPLQLITGEASASTMWDNQAWSYSHGDGEETEPPFLAQDFIHMVQPGAKIIIMLRDPAERLYSDYLYFKTANKSTEDFHQKVIESVQLFQSCLLGGSLRSCVYSASLSNSMPVRLSLGFYIVFLLDWLSVFPREQVLVLRLEDYAANLQGTLEKVFSFLNTGPLSLQVEAALTKSPSSNTRRPADRDLGPMLPSTRKLLWELHQPFNHKLATVLDNKAFLWSDNDFLQGERS
ncbi:carbohydrate sulfotransferase 15-like [Dunckerocampus dactyliophorus]|uniref:carbohydrate sulfotransferase 15-like n=1 Tax=Dunckerocampus dactyliophorus TaxID=161453 RepID=UPI0024075C8C|nr:carbohydrate sulfotransferase 15-like [Dunckerocampus dactyliophorus]XP_054655426.1 carbohydrate sulfotransferase 15-like [Dunckerocampus dactyliophorus]XP_054655427.1 carbohydrate sulfotransferase 15-like [Dunckerocampus dactyliophorus]